MSRKKYDHRTDHSDSYLYLHPAPADRDSVIEECAKYLEAQADLLAGRNMPAEAGRRRGYAQELRALKRPAEKG